ncbi:MAG: L,D-transpeptidase [Anaerolineales bacterium]|nr:L,D-transpeptidase [Anaerolineales bacterium]
MISRREFLKLSTLGLGSAILPFQTKRIAASEFPDAPRLGRVLVAGLPLKARPDQDSPTVRLLFEDEIISNFRYLVGSQPYRLNQTWIETEGGYAWSPGIQPVRYHPNLPETSLPATSLGEGFWAEVTVPYVALDQANPPARAPWLRRRLESGLPPRFFYQQIAWVDQIRVAEDGETWYRLNERFGYGDIFWAPAEALRPLTSEEMSPLSPEAGDKHIVVNISRQTISCFEGNSEVFFARVSTGALFNFQGERVDEWETPPGTHRIWRKSISRPLSGGSASAGWDLPAVGWITSFVGTGAAFHATYWHNNYGEPMSRGCVNCTPEDSKWIFRWTAPQVNYDPGDVTVGMPGGTLIKVVER